MDRQETHTAPEKVITNFAWGGNLGDKAPWIVQKETKQMRQTEVKVTSDHTHTHTFLMRTVGILLTFAVTHAIRNAPHVVSPLSCFRYFSGFPNQKACWEIQDVLFCPCPG